MYTCTYDYFIHVAQRDASGRVVSMEGRLDLENTDYKNTQKLTWLAETASHTPSVCVHFDHLITKGVLKPEDDFKDYVNFNSRVCLFVYLSVCLLACFFACLCACMLIHASPSSISRAMFNFRVFTLCLSFCCLFVCPFVVCTCSFTNK